MYDVPDCPERGGRPYFIHPFTRLRKAGIEIGIGIALQGNYGQENCNRKVCPVLMLRASAIGLSSDLTPLPLSPFVPSSRSSPRGPLPRTLTIPGTTVIHLLVFPNPNRGWLSQSTNLHTFHIEKRPRRAPKRRDMAATGQPLVRFDESSYYVVFV